MRPGPRFFLCALTLLLPLSALAQADLMVFRYEVPREDEERLAGWFIETTFLVSNLGPDIAKNVVVTFEHSPALSVIFANDGTAPCEVGEGVVRCRTAELPASTAACCRKYTARFATPLAEQTVSVKITATSDTPDNNTANNSIGATWNLVLRADLHVSASPPLSRVDPGSRVEIRTDVRNFLPTSPGDLHVDFEAAGGTIETIAPPNGWHCSVGAQSARCSAAALVESCRCSGTFVTTLQTRSDRAGGRATLAARASSSLPEWYTPNDEATAEVQTYRWLTVTSTADYGSGSLRWAIEDANQTCGSDPCRIAFEIPGPPPDSGWFTIAPATPLPPITASRVVVDGATQTAFTGNTNASGPEIAIDGSSTSTGDGLEIRSACQGVVNALAVGNFPLYGVACSMRPGDCLDRVPSMANQPLDHHLISNNYLGTDPTGTEARPNLRGIRIEDADATIAKNVISGNRRSGIWAWGGSVKVTQNRIGTAADGKSPLPNGASGFFAGPETRFCNVDLNVIAFHPHMGVAIADGAEHVVVRQNSMIRNLGEGIDHGLDGPTLPTSLPDRIPNRPTILSAAYDAAAGKTLVTLTLRTELGYSYWAMIDLYASDEPDGDGETWLTSGIYDRARTTDGEPFTIAVAGDVRGRWIRATSTRMASDTWSASDERLVAGTSELSSSVLVAP